jgi:hypothetical protein
MGQLDRRTSLTRFELGSATAAAYGGVEALVSGGIPLDLTHISVEGFSIEREP